MYLLGPGGWRNTITNGRFKITDGTNTSPFNTTFYMGAGIINNPTVQSQAAYLQHRIGGDLGGFVHVALAAELRIAGGSNQGVALNAFEASIVLPSGAQTLTNLRAITANITVPAGVTGTLTSAQMVRAQTMAALPVGFTIDTLHSLYVEAQTVATTNYSIYVAGGQSVIPLLTTTATGTIGTIFRGISGQTAAAWVVQNAAGTTLIQAFPSGVMGIGGTVSGPSFWVNNNVASDGAVNIVVKAKSTQTGDQQQWRKSDDTVLYRIVAGGWPRFTALTNSNPAEGDLWYDGTNLRFRDATTTRTISWT